MHFIAVCLHTLFRGAVSSNSHASVFVFVMILVNITGFTSTKVTVGPRKFCENPDFNECNGNITTVLEEFKKNYPIQLWKKYGLFKEEFLTRINPHWLKFPPPYPSSHYALAALYIFIAIFGLSGNAFVIFMFIRYVI